MRTAMTRVFWYLGLVLMAVGFGRIPSLNVADAFTPALATYIPISLFWLLFGKLLVGRREASLHVFGIRPKIFSRLLLFGGCALAALLLYLDQTLAASFALGTALCGADGLLQLRREGAESA
jgi:hypothetical protein